MRYLKLTLTLGFIELLFGMPSDFSLTALAPLFPLDALGSGMFSLFAKAQFHRLKVNSTCYLFCLLFIRDKRRKNRKITRTNFRKLTWRYRTSASRTSFGSDYQAYTCFPTAMPVRLVITLVKGIRLTPVSFQKTKAFEGILVYFQLAMSRSWARCLDFGLGGTHTSSEAK